MEEDTSLGKMVEHTMESIEMTKRKVKDSSHGQMEENMLENGTLASSMELVITQQLKVKQEGVSGKMARGSNG